MPTQNLRQVFVQMLFALTVGQVALKIGDLILLETDFIGHLYIYSHLTLCIIILSTSWVGWQTSQSIGNTDKINLVFDLQYLILLLDIFLVICYFIMLSGVEYNDKLHRIDLPNSKWELQWTIVIFSCYLLWDFLTKFFKIDYVQAEGQRFQKHTSYNWIDFIDRGKYTIICLLLTLCVYLLMQDANTNFKCVIADICLISILFIFRGLKQEVKSEYKLQQEQCPESFKKQIEESDNQITYPLHMIESKKKHIFKVVVIKYFFGVLLIIAVSIYILNEK